MRKIFAGLVALCCLSCETHQDVVHEGLSLTGNTEVRIDTIHVSLSESSGYGNFYMTDNVITFADVMTCRFYDIDLSGNIVQEYFRKGRGDNEIPSMLYAYPIIGDPLKRGVIIDSGNGITFYDLKTTDGPRCFPHEKSGPRTMRKAARPIPVQIRSTNPIATQIYKGAAA